MGSSMGRRDSSRIARVGDQIQRQLAQILATELADARVPAVTVSGVEVSRDLRNARVFLTPPAGSDPDTVLRAVNHAASFLRRRLGERVRMKYLPRLRFEYDVTLDRAERLAALLEQAKTTRGSGDIREGET